VGSDDTHWHALAFRVLFERERELQERRGNWSGLLACEGAGSSANLWIRAAAAEIA
jgi:hypothetical protein